MKIRNEIRVSLLTAVCCLAVLLFSGCGGDDADFPPTVDVTGTWRGNYSIITDETDLTTAEISIQMVLSQHGSQVTGITSLLGEITGKVNANIFTIDGTDLAARVDGNTMRGTFTSGTGHLRTFTLTR